MSLLNSTSNSAASSVSPGTVAETCIPIRPAVPLVRTLTMPVPLVSDSSTLVPSVSSIRPLLIASRTWRSPVAVVATRAATSPWMRWSSTVNPLPVPEAWTSTVNTSAAVSIVNAALPTRVTCGIVTCSPIPVMVPVILERRSGGSLGFGAGTLNSLIVKLPLAIVARRNSDAPSPSDIEPLAIVNDVVEAFCEKVTSARSVWPATTSATPVPVTFTKAPCGRSRLTVRAPTVNVSWKPPGSVLVLTWISNAPVSVAPGTASVALPLTLAPTPLALTTTKPSPPATVSTSSVPAFIRMPALETATRNVVPDDSIANSPSIRCPSTTSATGLVGSVRESSTRTYGPAGTSTASTTVTEPVSAWLGSSAPTLPIVNELVVTERTTAATVS